MDTRFRITQKGVHQHSLPVEHPKTHWASRLWGCSCLDTNPPALCPNLQYTPHSTILQSAASTLSWVQRSKVWRISSLKTWSNWFLAEMWEPESYIQRQGRLKVGLLWGSFLKLFKYLQKLAKWDGWVDCLTAMQSLPSRTHLWVWKILPSFWRLSNIK